jgi:hypothetical protein
MPTTLERQDTSRWPRNLREFTPHLTACKKNDWIVGDLKRSKLVALRRQVTSIHVSGTVPRPLQISAQHAQCPSETPIALARQMINIIYLKVLMSNNDS